MGLFRNAIEVVASSLAVVSLAGCFENANTSELSCTQDKYCPDGYVCVGVQIGLPGKCQKQADAGSLGSAAADGSRTFDGASVSVIDGSLDNGHTLEVGTIDLVPATDSIVDKVSPVHVDAEIDSSSLIDGASPVDSSRVPDVPADLPDAPVPSPEAGIDGMPDLPPLVPEAGPEAQRDTFSNPDLGPGCAIGGAFYPSGKTNPDNACQGCQPTFSSTGWTMNADGATCGDGQVCGGGTCQSGCWIGGTLLGSGAANTINPCQICKPSDSTTSWSTKADSSDCGSGRICGGGTCQSACFLGGTIYPAGATNPSNPCQACTPLISTTVWAQTRPDCAAIVAGDQFSCAAVGGSAKCWGSATQLGNGATSNSRVPLQVTGLTGGVQAIAASGSGKHACALVNGGVQCWGTNGQGQLGNNSTAKSGVPVQVVGLLTGMRGVSAGYDHTCALSDGGVKCWGANTYGQLGDGTQAQSLVPIDVQKLAYSPVVVAAGRKLTCQAWGSGVQCWGDNSTAQLGSDPATLSQSLTPVTINGISGGPRDIAAGGSHSCALVNGVVLCWGGNGSGQLGNNSFTDSPTPVSVQGLPANVTAMGAGVFHSCAVASGSVWCWGDNYAGQLGISASTDKYPTANAVSGLPSAAMAVACGTNHTCALLVSGAVWCWGYNDAGQLGNGDSGDSPTPVAVQGL